MIKNCAKIQCDIKIIIIKKLLNWLVLYKNDAIITHTRYNGKMKNEITDFLGDRPLSRYDK